MKFTTASSIAYLAAVAKAGHSEATFAVLRFNGDQYMTEGRTDPIVNPGVESPHYHGIMGGNAFGKSVQGEQLLQQSNCTSAKIARDFSNYWTPTLFFQDPNNEKNFTKVPLNYMNVYYFFDETDDDIVAFPPGLKIFTGDKDTRSPPSSGTGAKQIFSNKGDIQPVQWTCPRSTSSPASYPADSDGTRAGLAEPGNSEGGVGFPMADCDGLYSPLRADIHMPSCYNPDAGLDDYKNNMAYPEVDMFSGKVKCAAPFTVHVPHMFYEVYWDTQKFSSAWVPDGKTQPFVLSNGDRTGYSLHADFISGWDEEALNWIIANCNAGTLGMDTCAGIPGGLNTDNDCKLDPPVPEPIDLINTVGAYLEALPGKNPLSGWGVGDENAVEEGEEEASSYETSAQSTPTSSAVAAAETYVASSPTSSPEAAATYEAAEVYNAAEANGDGAPMSTVWDIVTVTAFSTATEYAAPTPPAKRHLHGHEHMARHQRRGFAGRR